MADTPPSATDDLLPGVGKASLVECLRAAQVIVSDNKYYSAAQGTGPAHDLYLASVEFLKRQFMMHNAVTMTK